ncbi:MAG: [protein-PII] uridylyltransferase [Actinomycetota bacterium]|nr:[protein-PII] uridylyltransferase [Actinomycetota bacterium]
MVEVEYGEYMSIVLARQNLLEDRTMRGSEFTLQLSDSADNWLKGLFSSVVGERSDISLLAVGGYGRRDLSPLSDLDVLLLHRKAKDIDEVAEALWYPIWDQGEKLGHSVRTIEETLDLASSDLDTATALLSCRQIAGSSRLADELTSLALAQWRNNARSWLPKLAASIQERHRSKGEVAFMLEPELKEGRGGLRDVHTMGWANQTGQGPLEVEHHQLLECYEIILRARVELHRSAKRSGDKLLLEQQDAVSAALGYDDADFLMADVASAARRIAWNTDELCYAIQNAGLFRLWNFGKKVGDTITGRRKSVSTSYESDADFTAETVLRIAVTTAKNQERFTPEVIKQLRKVELEIPDPWTREIRDLFVELLLAGHDAIPVFETLDELDLFVPFLPEWEPARSRPQRNAYHRFTVDRHLLETAAEAARLQDRVERPDLLVVGALLHDIGKPYPGDHTEVGIELISTIGRRMGFPDVDVNALIQMCEHHLLLPDIATRRDLDDFDTIQTVANSLQSIQKVELLHALTEADSIATGPAAWSSWKAGLVHDLATRTAAYLKGGEGSIMERTFPNKDQMQMMRRGMIRVEGNGDRLTIMEIDRPGVFGRVAGALSLCGLDVLEAVAHTDYGMVLAVFRVAPSTTREIDWDSVCVFVQDSVRGRVAIAARLSDRMKTYHLQSSLKFPDRVVGTDVKIDNETSSTATVVEVSAPNGMGLLYQITRALSSLDLDILSAKVQTLGADVVDSFYVLDNEGKKIIDPTHAEEVKEALRHAIEISTVMQRKSNDG